ncbi:hypothetical protein GCM10008107_09530 [Psychrosphaera saromensis]|jgi:hypothetical protein|uniref:DUF3392 domain-containing protein n=1 Tax=Psychrosphaera saromensis TaxID=716813 RepID=A0A2S7UUX6_9GAMM|nr:DUF3392 family protein [Psychrosphaera saromensis]PQJ53757.1 hypothetical protein BTO11_08840 [Psychrosphaera saromensis]GHB62539.1 hypothetical protein GCM10008107_09530 [Psychrosphaera saromensis]GLQ15456.1 hypothetical protein GCM10007917_29110 [Psychrosphaera saromensis]
MYYIYDVLVEVGGVIRPYSDDIALALVASLLVIAGADINNYIKNLIKSAHFLVRMSIFIAVCTFGYGALTVLLTNIITTQLAALPAMYLPLAVIACFAALGIYAERKRQL